MNPSDAIRLMVKHIPGGWDAVGVLCGKSGETLRHAFSGKDVRYVPSLVDACTISEHAISIRSEHCHAFANAIAVGCGGFIKLEVREAPAASLMAATVGSVSASTDLLESVTAARADGVISDNEKREIEAAAAKSIEKLQAVLIEVHRENAASKPLRAVL